MKLEDALQEFLKRIEVIVSMEMGHKITTKEAYKQIKEEIRKLKKVKKATPMKRLILLLLLCLLLLVSCGTTQKE